AGLHRDSWEMFSGLIEEVGRGVSASDQPKRLEISAPRLSAKVAVGDSVAVNGRCLTIAQQEGHHFSFEVLQESIDRTNLNTLQPGSKVNLEVAIAAGSRLGGHFVQGHVDCAAAILALDETDSDLRLEIELPPDFARYVAHKGSIARTGLSVTVAEILPTSFAVWIIPHT